MTDGTISKSAESSWQRWLQERGRLPRQGVGKVTEEPIPHTRPTRLGRHTHNPCEDLGGLSDSGKTHTGETSGWVGVAGGGREEGLGLDLCS